MSDGLDSGTSRVLNPDEPCQECGDAPRETTVLVTIGGIPAGPLFVCEDCGRPKTEHVDCGTWGYYECWWCTGRASGAGGVEGVAA